MPTFSIPNAISFSPQPLMMYSSRSFSSFLSSFKVTANLLQRQAWVYYFFLRKMLTLAFCDCAGIQFISWGYQNVSEMSHQAVTVNWVMNEHFISLAHGTNALVRITVTNLSYTPRESIPLFLASLWELLLVPIIKLMLDKKKVVCWTILLT